jgi:hypothetical protein
MRAFSIPKRKLKRIKKMKYTTEIELAVKIMTPIVTIAGILFGVWQFTKGQENLQKKELEQRQFELKKMQMGKEFEAIAKFKEAQSIKYKEAAETVSNIIYSDDYNSPEFKKNLKRFWQLYWVELSAVEDQTVESAMKYLGDYIEGLEKRNFKNMTEEDKEMLFRHGYAVAQAIKISSKNWELPQGIGK